MQHSPRPLGIFKGIIESCAAFTRSDWTVGRSVTERVLMGAILRTEPDTVSLNTSDSDLGEPSHTYARDAALISAYL